MDAGIQAMDGNLTLVQVPHFDNVVRQSLPSLDAGFRHPCRNDVSPTLVYNDERILRERYNPPRLLILVDLQGIEAPITRPKDELPFFLSHHPTMHRHP